MLQELYYGYDSRWFNDTTNVFSYHTYGCVIFVCMCVCVVSFLIRPQGGGNANWASQSKHTVYNIHMIWHKYIVSINLMTVPHTDGRHYLRQLDLISLCVTIVTASPFVVWFKVCWKNNDILGQCHLMPLETSWNHIATLNCLDYAALCRQEKSEAHGGTPAFAPGPSGPSPCEACEARAVGSAGTAGTGTVGTVELDRFDRFDRLDACRGGVQGVQGGVQGVMAQESHPQTIQHINIYDILQHLYKYNIYKIIGNIILYYDNNITCQNYSGEITWRIFESDFRTFQRCFVTFSNFYFDYFEALCGAFNPAGQDGLHSLHVLSATDFCSIPMSGVTLLQFLQGVLEFSTVWCFHLGSIWFHFFASYCVAALCETTCQDSGISSSPAYKDHSLVDPCCPFSAQSRVF